MADLVHQIEGVALARVDADGEMAQVPAKLVEGCALQRRQLPKGGTHICRGLRAGKPIDVLDAHEVGLAQEIAFRAPHQVHHAVGEGTHDVLDYLVTMRQLQQRLLDCRRRIRWHTVVLLQASGLLQFDLERVANPARLRRDDRVGIALAGLEDLVRVEVARGDLAHALGDFLGLASFKPRQQRVVERGVVDSRELRAALEWASAHLGLGALAAQKLCGHGALLGRALALPGQRLDQCVTAHVVERRERHALGARGNGRRRVANHGLDVVQDLGGHLGVKVLLPALPGDGPASEPLLGRAALGRLLLAARGEADAFTILARHGAAHLLEQMALRFIQHF